jgi:esterase
VLQNLTPEKNDPKTWKWRINLPVIRKHLGDALGAFQYEGDYPGPALFVRGGKSKYIIDEYRPTIEEFFPRAEIQTIKGVGHWVHSENPQEFIRIVGKFMSDVDAEQS